MSEELNDYKSSNFQKETENEIYKVKALIKTDPSIDINTLEFKKKN